MPPGYSRNGAPATRNFTFHACLSPASRQQVGAGGPAWSMGRWAGTAGGPVGLAGGSGRHSSRAGWRVLPTSRTGAAACFVGAALARL